MIDLKQSGSRHLKPMAEIEVEIIRHAIDYYGGNVTEAARRLGLGRSTIYRKIGGK